MGVGGPFCVIFYKFAACTPSFVLIQTLRGRTINQQFFSIHFIIHLNSKHHEKILTFSSRALRV